MKSFQDLKKLEIECFNVRTLKKESVKYIKELCKISVQNKATVQLMNCTTTNSNKLKYERL